MDGNSLSVIGLTIQCAGIVLITCLSFFMSRSIRRPFLDYWTSAWVCMSVALISLAVGFRTPSLATIYFALYFLGEYAFGFLFIAGCHNYATGGRLARPHWLWLAASAGLSFGLARLSTSFSAAFVPHAGILAVLFALAFRALRPARLWGRRSLGLSAVNIALVLLAADFMHYVPVVAYAEFFHGSIPGKYLQYTSIYDLILETLLGFGSLMLVMERARHEVEAANRELRSAHEQLERLAQVDPLTEALNRHAFYSLIGRQRGPGAAQRGCVVVLDIDNLKPINDSHGHAAGDAAIRAVARTVRSMIRADDLLFRWGGDEFLILFFNLNELEARRRLTDIEVQLALAHVPEADAPVIVSHGLAAFAATDEIERAIDLADGAMYARKQARKAGQLVG
ncbi:MAG TPA: GGDEF domain-containing protein [Blastocatellia bacterium]|nr:GGDEF domain-containing protein [Blastocatellia bacterium]